MNRVCLIGRLTKAPVVTETKKGNKVCHITLAVPRRKGTKGADFIDITFWRSLAELVAKYCGSGDLLGVDGYLEVSSYMAEGGERRKSVSVIAETIDFCGQSKNNRGQDLPAGRIEDMIPPEESEEDDSDVPF